MNTRKNKSRLMKAIPRRQMVAVSIGGLLLLAALVLVQAMGPRESEARYTHPDAVKPEPQQEPTGHSEYLVSLTRKAINQGFGQESVVLLAPQPGPGREVVARELRAMLMRSRAGSRLAATDLKEGPADKRILSFVGERSYLEVYTDGSKFRFRADIDDPKVAAQAVSYEKLGKEVLETLGRRFIGETLGNIVKLGANESLTFLGVRYLRDGGGIEDGKTSSQVIANIAIFGREVNGIPVVGSGSKVAVWFTGDRQPAGFDVDWPVYQVTQTRQPVMAQDKLRARVEAVTTAPQRSSQSRVTRFECGYVDLGATKRGAQIQAGCSVSYQGRSGSANAAGETLEWARVEFVPAAVQVLRDPKWPLANLIASGREPTARSMESINLGGGQDPGADPSKDEGRPARPTIPLRPRP